MHYGICEKERNKFFKYRQIGYMQRDCPSRVTSGANKIHVNTLSSPTLKGATSASGSNTGRNCLYALITRQDSKSSLNIVTGMLKLFSGDIYYLLDSRSTLSYVTPNVAIHFGFDPECIPDPFSMSTKWVTLLWLENYIGVV